MITQFRTFSFIFLCSVAAMAQTLSQPGSLDYNSSPFNIGTGPNYKVGFAFCWKIFRIIAQ